MNYFETYAPVVT
jgi:hypothetical protein